MLFATALCCSLLPTAGQAYTPEQQQACSDDAFRLCGPEIPDVDRVTACMIARKDELSPGCRVFFRAGPEPVVDTGAPINIRPTARKHTAPKAHTSKTGQTCKTCKTGQVIATPAQEADQDPGAT